MKIQTTENAKSIYKVVYDIPDDLIEEYNRIKEDGDMDLLRDFLDEYAEVLESETDGSAYGFEIVSVDAEK